MSHSSTTQDKKPQAADIILTIKALIAISFISPALPALKPSHPIKSKITPKKA